MTRNMLAFALALLASPALAEMVVETNGILTDSKGMTLYTFDMDKDGMSACYDECAVNWPPLLADEGATAEGDFGLTERTDGTMQWTYQGMPLYLWVKDTKPGDTTGDGVKGVWHTAMVKG
jgi:predicted lipoprotein with Yx(FWY)xxD motif